MSSTPKPRVEVVDLSCSQRATGLTADIVSAAGTDVPATAVSVAFPDAVPPPRGAPV